MLYSLFKVLIAVIFLLGSSNCCLVSYTFYDYFQYANKKYYEINIEKVIKILSDKNSKETFIKLLDVNTNFSEIKFLKQNNETHELLLTELENVNDKLIKEIIEKERMKTKRIYFIFTGIIVFLIIFIFYIIIHSHKEKLEREKLIRQYEEKVISGIGTHLPAKKDSVVDTNENQTMDETNRKIQLIQLIEKEMLHDKNRMIATKLIEPYINDKDIDVKLQALKTLYYFDEDKALKMLLELSKSSDPDIRIKTVDVVSDITSVKSIQILFDMINDVEISVRKKVLKKLIDIKNRKLIPSKEFNEKLELLLKEIQRKENWIME